MKKLLITQSIILLSGTAFAWYNVVRNFVRFYHTEGTLFKIHNCLIPNPVTEACFYGAVAFLIAFIWSAYILYAEHRVRHQRYLWWLLGAGALFAWFTVTKEFITFYSARTGPALGCSAIPITNPFFTPCFTGALLFLIATVLAGLIYFRINVKKV